MNLQLFVGGLSFFFAARFSATIIKYYFFPIGKTNTKRDFFCELISNFILAVGCLVAVLSN